MTKPSLTAQQVATLKTCADHFHQILSALTARRMLADGAKMPAKIRDSLYAKAIEQPAIEKLAADGFSLVVKLMAEAGAPDVSIQTCTPKETP